MDGLTPSVMSAVDLLEATKCDGQEITKNLFKDHKPSIVVDDHKRQKLETYLRIRSLEDYGADHRKSNYQMLDGSTLLAIPPKTSNASKEGAKRFNFTKIFDESANQSVIYDSCGLPIVRRFLGGENGLLFAYGITSSGKSYTMRGTTTKPGIIPRSLNTIFEVIGSKIQKEVSHLKPESFTKCSMLSDSDRQLEEGIRQFIFDRNDKSFEIQMNSFRSQISVINENSNLMNDVLHSTFRSEDSNIKCSVWISFYEIYNEEVNDLLELDVEGEKKRKAKLFRDESGNYFVSNLRQICVSSAEQAYKVLIFGQDNLHISSTNLNKNSSRSHCAFNITLIITSSHPKRSTYNMNHLSICDLAGAERSEKALNSGERIREAGKINGSLLSLSRVISAIRHNQRFEHDQSRQRFVNYRDSKLTKVFQPFLSGSGVAAMISTMNPSANLFDETFFALKFTGVASQVVVSCEDQRNKFHDSLKRLTQLWMQSSQRWSNFAHLQQPKPSVSIIQAIKEEDEDEDHVSNDNGRLDITVQEFKEKVEEITQMDLSRADPQEIEILRTQIDFLVEKLKQTENDKMEMEMEVRRQVVSEFNKMIADMEEMANNKDKAKKKLEEMMTERLINNENLYKQEKIDLEFKISLLENENFKLTEELCQLKDKLKAVKVIEDQSEQKIKELELKIASLSAIQQNNVSISDVCTSPIVNAMCHANTSTRVSVNDANTSTRVSVNDANTSTRVSVNDANTSTRVLVSDANTSICVSVCDVNTSFTPVIAMTTDCETSTTSLNEVCDQMTNTSVECTDKSTFVDNRSLALCEDKETETEGEVALTSPEADETVLCEMAEPAKEESVPKREYLELLKRLENAEMEVKEKLAIIAFDEKITKGRDAKLKELEEENKRLHEKLNSEFGLHQIFKSSKPSSIAGSSVTSKSAASEDTTSITSSDSYNDVKQKKSAKYSSRKRKPNADTSHDKRYLSSINDMDTSSEDKCPSSQASLNSVEACADEIGNNVYSSKKNRKIKRKADNCCENEAFKTSRGPESKRKRPPLSNITYSPISPIPSVDRVTRSKAKKCLQF